MDQEIVDYILQAQKHGLAEMEIKQNLLDAGWDANTVEQSLIFARAADTHSGANETPQLLAGYPASQKPGLNRQPAAFQNTHTTLTISEESFKEKSPSLPFLKNKIFWLILGLFLVLGASALGYYKYIYATPQKVFDKFLAVKRPLVFQSDYSLSYSYTDASTTQPIIFTFSGTTYNNGQNASSSESSNAFTLALKSSDESASVNSQYLLLNQVLYFDISKISQLKSLGSTWIKLDLGQLQNYFNAHSTTTSQSFNNLLANKELKTKIQNALANAKIVNFGNSLAKETVKNTPTYHLKITLDSQALAKTATQIIDLIQNDPSFTGEKITDAQKNEMSAILEKITLKEGDIWIGQKDSQLYRMHFVLNVPSAQDLAKPDISDSIPAISQARAKSRDAKRLGDVRMIATALELYYNDYGGYPAGLNGVPQNLAPNYIGEFPSAPNPADGACTDYFNGYWYKSAGTAFTKNGIKLYPDFNLTFCLGQATGGYDAGIGMVTPQGIKGNISCPATPDLCVNSNPVRPEDLQSNIDNLHFNSLLTFEDTFYNFGKTQSLKAPEKSLDLMQLLQSFFGSMSGNGTTTTQILVQ
jgi:hypothetical protein